MVEPTQTGTERGERPEVVLARVKEHVNAWASANVSLEQRPTDSFQKEGRQELELLHFHQIQQEGHARWRKLLVQD